MKKIVVGMSGGVDSSVAALLLVQAGYEVVGASMRLFACNRVGRGSCCSEEDRHDARAVCEHIGIPFVTMNLIAPFERSVIDPFIDAYLKGETPSPCIVCNERMKFAAFHEEALKLGADTVATGHYARIVRSDDGRRILMRGVDAAKDQSYFLFPALGGALEHLSFPVGELTKDEVRAIAREHHLPVHDKAESQEVCFVPDDDYAAFIEERRPSEVPGPGRFVDRRGVELGRHRGIHAYTIGQRRGLGKGFGKRTYVVRIDAARNEVVLGDDDDLWSCAVRVRDVVWASGKECPDHALVQIRYRHDAQRARIERKDDVFAVTFDEPQRAIAPGQAAVLYDGDVVIGGGWIDNDVIPTDRA